VEQDRRFGGGFEKVVMGLARLTLAFAGITSSKRLFLLL